MNKGVDIHSDRAHKARYAHHLSSRSLHMGAWGVMLFLIALGVFDLVYGVNLAYLLFIPAIWIGMSLLWYNNELKNLKPTVGQDLSDILDWKVLAKLHSVDPTAADLWTAIKDHSQTYFFLARYGIPPLADNLDQTNIDIGTVWQQAIEYQKVNGFDELNAACLFVSLFKNTPNAQDTLTAQKLEMSEIEAGIAWVSHIEQVIKQYKTHRKTGGIARDWAVGFTPLLNQIGHNISRQIEISGMVNRPIPSHKVVVDQMLQVLSQADRTNIALVGEVGTGKTTAVYALAEQLLSGVSTELKYHQIFSLNAATLLSSAHHPGQMEELIFRIANEAHHARNIIIFLDEAQVFLQEGTGAVDLSNLLQNLIQSTGVRFIFAMSPHEWQRLQQENAALAGLINYQLLQPTDQSETIQILEDESLLIEAKHQVVITYPAIKEAYRLAEHYITGEAFPGKAVKLMEQAAVKAGKNNPVTAQTLQQTIESAKGVKIQTATQAESSQLLNLEDELHKQMINQKYAVKAVADALRRARAGTHSPDRPIGAFLFLGPTGVGKTQLAKALASTYFGDVNSIVRVDMNEYINPGDINRLLAAKSPSASGMTFLEHIRRTPFSVVLLDEIEKADPDIINVFLQLLDEGTISDTDGQAASFKDAIIIATSNAGADKIREYISAGRDQAEFQPEFIEGIMQAGYFKPELLNRFDEILVFRPLNEDELLQVVDLMIADVNKTLDQKKVKVEVDEEAKKWLVANGNDPRLGARPMRRAVEQYVENIVAKRILEGSAAAGATIKITVADFTS